MVAKQITETELKDRKEKKDNEVVSLYRFPNKKNMEEHERWIDVVKK